MIGASEVVLLPVPADYTSRFTLIFENIARELSDNQAFHEVIPSDVTNEANARGFQPDRLLELITYIEANLGEDLSARKLAERFHHAEQHFYRTVRKVTGRTLNQYVKARRMERAKGLLEGTDLSITEIAALVGIPDLAQFSRTFRAHTGCSPSQYRAMRTTC